MINTKISLAADINYLNISNTSSKSEMQYRYSESYQYSETVQVLLVERLQPQPIIICGVATVEQGTNVGHHNQNQNDQRCQHQPAGGEQEEKQRKHITAPF